MANEAVKSCYPFLYVDALYIPIKSKGKAINKAIYTIIGLDNNGHKEYLGFWIGEKEGTHYWLSIFYELKSRGVEKLSFISIDSLSGLEDVIKSIYPGAIIQRCIVHLVCNSLKYVPINIIKNFVMIYVPCTEQ